MATKIIIEPVFEADFQPCSYGFRPKRSAKQAMDRIFEVAEKGGALWVIDADIKDYFGCINHDKLLFLVKQRITDRRVLKLLNPKIIGMRNYYARRFTRPWLWKIEKYINYKFTRWYNRKKQRKYRLENAAKVRELTLQAGLASICG